jgi:predicted nuclease of restriction endonuclease-like (RecB) superfamily
LVAKRGRSYEEKNLRRMMQFAEQFIDEQRITELGRHLSWSHFLALLPLKTMQAKAFYAQQAIDGRLGVRSLRELIHKKAFERCEVANAQLGDGSTVPLDTFRDPYLLDFLNMRDRYQERDLEEAILHDLEAFLLEVGNGLAFIGRQTRMPMGDRDYHLDLLFFSRPLRRLVAVELKIGESLPEYMGQMHFYLKWLNRYQRGESEAAPIGLILCTSADREQIELMELHKDNIVVAQYWTELLPKAELEERIKIILRDAKERLTRRQLLLGEDKDEG